MKRLLLGLLAVIVLYFLAHWLFVALASDETRIRWLLEDMAGGFNETNARAVVAGLAEDFKEETDGCDRNGVRLGLNHLFLTQRDARTREFPYRVEIGVESLRIAVDAAGRTARVELVARFHESRGEAARVAWEVRIEGELRKGDGGWEVIRSRHETAAGRMPR
jgi:hypothetical protein